MTRQNLIRFNEKKRSKAAAPSSQEARTKGNTENKIKICLVHCIIKELRIEEQNHIRIIFFIENGIPNLFQTLIPKKQLKNLFNTIFGFLCFRV